MAMILFIPSRQSDVATASVGQGQIDRYFIPAEGPYTAQKNEVITFVFNPDGSCDRLLMSEGYSFDRVLE
jgi:hypothetical protein